MTYDEMVEKVARGLCGPDDVSYGKLLWEGWKPHAVAALAALDLHPEGDNWLAPKEPSDAMFEAIEGGGFVVGYEAMRTAHMREATE